MGERFRGKVPVDLVRLCSSSVNCSAGSTRTDQADLVELIWKNGKPKVCD